mgnify:FL=1
MPAWAPIVALTVSLVIAWLNFLLTAKWAALPGALHGWKGPWYAAALAAATLLTWSGRRQVGRAVALTPRAGRVAS